VPAAAVSLNQSRSPPESIRPATLFPALTAVAAAALLPWSSGATIWSVALTAALHKEEPSWARARTRRVPWASPAVLQVTLASPLTTVASVPSRRSVLSHCPLPFVSW